MATYKLMLARQIAEYQVYGAILTRHNAIAEWRVLEGIKLLALASRHGLVDFRQARAETRVYKMADVVC